MMEIQNSTARPKWAVVKNALDVGKTITTAPAEVIVYNPVPGAFELGRPSKIAGGDIPVGMFQQLERFQAEFYEIAGIHDFSHGLSGLGGVRAGFALQMLLEEDATRTGILKRAFDESCIKTGSGQAPTGEAVLHRAAHGHDRRGRLIGRGQAVLRRQDP